MITIQWDAMLAEQFDMYYIDSEGKKVRPYIIHRTSIGCYERTLAWLIEKYEGAFPTWLCPEQVRILPVSDKYADYAQQVYKQMKEAGILVTLDSRAEKVGYKMREVRMQKLPYAVVVGEKEAENGTVAVWSRKAGDKGAVATADFINDIIAEIKSKAL